VPYVNNNSTIEAARSTSGMVLFAIAPGSRALCAAEPLRTQLDGARAGAVRFSSSDHGGWGGAQMGQIRGGKLVLFGPPLTTTPAADSPITPYTTTPAPPPTSGIPSP
jgi:hypothetical protein